MTTGLILEGGGMRGIFTAGVIDYLIDEEFEFKNIIGVSAGACHGCSYVCGQRGRAYATNTDYLGNKEYCSYHSLRKTGDLFGAEFVYHRIPEELYPIDNAHFLESGIDFRVAVTNCETGKAEYPRIKDMHQDVEYVRASSSLPFFANMVEVGGQLYMDGGIADSIPIKQSLAQGNDKNVIVLTRPRGYKKKASRSVALAALKYKKYPNLVKALAHRHRVYNRALDHIAKLEAEGKAFVIAPMGPLDIGRIEKDIKKMDKAYYEGYFVTEGLSEKLRAFLEK